jgi:bla regulator protein BlaR1
MSWLLIALLKNAIIVVPLAAAAFATGRCFRRPALAHVLWVLVLVKLLTPPLVDVPVGWSIDVSPWVAQQSPTDAARPANLSHSASAAPLATVIHRAADGSPLVRPSASGQFEIVTCEVPAQGKATAPPANDRRVAAGTSFTLPRLTVDWLSVLGIVWLMGSVVTAGLMLRRGLLFHKFLRLAARRDQRITSRVQHLAYSVGMVRAPAVIVVDGVVSPMLWGLGRQVQLVFPARLAERLGAAEIDSLLLHELAHYARGDYWVRLVELGAHVAYWWHPVVWWTRHEIEAAEEQCCDAWVVEHQSGTPRTYAEALLTTIDFLCEAAQPPQQAAMALPPAACGLGDVPLLRSRLKQIMRGELGGQLPRSVWVAVLIAGLIVSPLEPAVFATSTRERIAERAVGANRLSGPATTGSQNVETASGVPGSTPEHSRPAAPADISPPIADVPASPTLADIRPRSIVFARAQSANGRYTLEAATNDETTLSHPGMRLGLINSSPITCASFAPDSRSFVTGHADGNVRFWDSEAGGFLNKRFQTQAGSVVTVAYSPTGGQVAIGTSDGMLSVWDVEGESEIARWENPNIAVSCIRWSPRGDRVAAALGNWTKTSDARLLVWSPSTGKVDADESLVQPLGALDWLAGDVLLLADWNGGAIVRHLNGGRPEQSLSLEKDIVSAAHWSPDCHLLTTWQAEQLLVPAAR